jgi:hypothetical protein
MPFWTARVQLQKGAITGILWDDLDCKGFCTPSSPLCIKDDDEYDVDPTTNEPKVNKNCAVAPKTGYDIIQCPKSTAVINSAAETNSTTGGNCDLKVYLVWMGTDTRSQTMESDGLRLSQMMKYSISKTFTRASEVDYSGSAPITAAISTIVLVAATVVLALFG